MEGERVLDAGDANASLQNTDGGAQRFRCLRNQERFATEYGCGNATFALHTELGTLRYGIWVWERSVYVAYGIWKKKRSLGCAWCWIS
ncbi:hypothetical protein [Vibrio fluminensis]|uniref:hypothetical protein n=1 Tax=Vibrio fluminensis TaxID=2783614 RepID=UPI001887858E|nr:hypothetical protein [Vibrio fluminensis]